MAVTCDICGKRLRTAYNLRIHMAVHTGEKPHICDVCGKGFQQRWNLVTHVSRVHAGHRPFTCADCHRSFGYKSHFKTHVRSHFYTQLQVPDMIKNKLLHPHNCNSCERCFETARQLAQHKSTHARKQSFICDSCGETFSTRKRIQYHIFQHCQGAGMKRKSRLKDPTPCEICGKTIARYSMHKHLNIHTRKRVYPCNTCDRVFLEAGQRELHQRIHSGHKPHVCDICGKAFAQLGNLRVHKRRTHDAPLTGSQQKTKFENLHSQIETNCSISDNKDIKESCLEKIGATVGENMKTPECLRSINTITLGKTSNAYNKQNVKLACGNFTTELGDINNKCVTQKSIPTFPVENVPVTGSDTIHDFVRIAAQWVVGTEEPEDKESLKDVVSSSDLPDTSGATKDWTKKEKREVWDKLLSEIGNEEYVKEVLEQMQNKKGDKTLALLRRLVCLPSNSVVARHPSGALVWSCWDCQAQLRSRHLLLRHRLRHAPPHLRPHKCSICSRTFTQTGNLQHHMLVHRGEHRFTCEKCGALFRHRSHLKTHSRQHGDSTTAPRFHCATCGKATTSRFHLIQHIRIHTRERPYQCQTCGKQFAASSTYDRHMKVHQAIREHCMVCGMTFADSSSRRRHQASHDSRKGHLCTCGRTFTQQSSLRRHAPICSHATTIPNKPYHCSVCPKKFLQAAGLRRHSATHDPILKFPCRYCNLVLKTHETLQRHVRRKHENGFLPRGAY